MKALVLLALAAAAQVAAEAADIMALTYQLGFEPHHRNFVANLHDKQMMDFVGDSDLQTIGMSDAHREGFRALAKHLKDGTPLPAALLTGASDPSVFADDGFSVSGVSAAQLKAEAEAEDAAEREIEHLEAEKIAAATNEDYAQAAEIKARIAALQNAQQTRRSERAQRDGGDTVTNTAAAAAEMRGGGGDPLVSRRLRESQFPPALDNSRVAAASPLPKARPQTPDGTTVPLPADAPVDHDLTPHRGPDPTPVQQPPSNPAGTMADALAASQSPSLSPPPTFNAATDADLPTATAAAGADGRPLSELSEPSQQQQRRQALETMVGGLGISERFVPFVSNLVEKGTYAMVKPEELTGIGLGPEEVAAFAVISEWADTRVR